MTSVLGNAASRSPETTKVFVHISREKAALYRAIMRVFIESKERFVFQLRLQEIFDAIALTGLSEVPEPAEIESALVQLAEWGNLRIDGVENFYNQRHTFQITSQGEAAERALAFFDASSGRDIELHYSSPMDIGQVLQELVHLSRQAEPDAGKIHRNLLVLRTLFQDLSDTAQMLMARLEGGNDLQPPDARRVIDHGQRFIGELVLEADRTGDAIRDIEAAGLDRLFQVVAERSIRDGQDATPEAVAAVCSQWRSHWERFRSWFISQSDVPSNAQRLRERAREAIASLLSTIKSINDQRIQRIDRARDFRVLARWFAQAGSDAEAHLLWRAAFGLCSARHLGIDAATLDDREAHDVPPNTSWLEAPPLRVSVGPRDNRRNSQTSGLSRIIDRTTEREKLAATSHEEAQRLLNAQRRFGTGNRIRLSEVAHLETDEFGLFLDLLGEAVSARISPAEAVEIISGDGCLRIKLEPTGDGREALIHTPEGVLTGPDQWISIERISMNEVLEVS